MVVTTLHPNMNDLYNRNMRGYISCEIVREIYGYQKNAKYASR